MGTDSGGRRCDNVRQSGFYYAAYAYDRRGSPITASLCLFLEAWRMELPWLVVAKSLSMFTRCGICEYLRRQVDLTSRQDGQLLAALKARLGRHFEFQAAQRLAVDRIEEICRQSGSKKWCCLIDKMDQSKTTLPSGVFVSFGAQKND